MLDATAVNVALERIGADLDADLAGLQWTLNGCSLTLASFILLGGSLADRFGRRRMFVIGAAWFALASALCGLAPNVETLVATRALGGGRGGGSWYGRPCPQHRGEARHHPFHQVRAEGA